MCGRYVAPGQAAIERQWHIGRHNQPKLTAAFPTRYNVAPQQGNPNNYIPVIRQADDGELELKRMQWWLLPFWSKESRVKYSTFNARVETVVKAASFRDPFKKRRCIIPAMGWYEWQELDTGNLPWYLHAANDELLGFAGLWDRWQHEDEVIESCTIIVGPANQKFMPIHDRMPFLILPDREKTWLDSKLNDPARVMDLLKPVPDDAVEFYRVNPRVNNARNQGEILIERLPEISAR